MRGQIVERNGNYSVVISYKDPITGQWKKKWQSAGKSIRQAEKLRTKLLSEADKGVITKPNRLTLEDHIKTWLELPAIKTLAPRTKENYEYLINKYILPDLGKVQVNRLTQEQIEKFESKILGEDGSKIRTTQMVHSILHKVLDLAVTKNLIIRNVADQVAPPRTKKREMKVLTDKEIILVLELARNTSFYPLLYTALFTGMRRGELLGLKWNDINFDLATISVQRGLSHIRYGQAKGKTIEKSPKTAKGKRLIPISESTKEVLSNHYSKTLEIRKKLNMKKTDVPDEKATDEDYVTPDDYVFSSNYLGQAFDPCSISRAWNRISKKAGIKNIRFHDLRHTFATMLLAKSTHPKVVSELLGHSTSAITMDLYSHVSPTMQRDAISKIDKMVSSPGSIS